jgi:hypothetical protein
LAQLNDSLRKIPGAAITDGVQMGEKVEKVSGSYFRGFTVGGSDVLPILRRRVDGFNTPASVTTAGAETYTAAQIARGIILRDPNGAPRTDTLPTAAFLITGVPNVYTLGANGDEIVFSVQNVSPTHSITLATNTGVTLLGDIVVPGSGSRLITVTRTGSATVQAVATNPLAVPGASSAVATTISANSNQTYTAAQVVGGYIVRSNGTTRTDTTPTGTQLSAAVPSLGVGSSFDLIINSTGAGDVTLAGDTGVTIVGGPTVTAGEVGVVRFVKTGTNTFKAVFLA